MGKIVQLLESFVQIDTGSGILHGSLITQENKEEAPLVMIIAGSGPTDRDGNTHLAGKNNSLKFLAQELGKKGIATFRYDKRGAGESRNACQKEEDLRFENFVNDAVNVLNHLKKNFSFTKIIAAGHSEGALIAMAAGLKTDIHGYISISGPGRPAWKVLLSQLKPKLPQSLYSKAEEVIEKLKNGETPDNIPDQLFNLFRPSALPYLISWFKYNPAELIKELNIPILIAQGTTDIQVSADNAKILNSAAKNPDLTIIKGMNHVLKNVEGGLQEQLESYQNPDLPVSRPLIDSVSEFVNKLR